MSLPPIRWGWAIRSVLAQMVVVILIFLLAVGIALALGLVKP